MRTSDPKLQVITWSESLIFYFMPFAFERVHDTDFQDSLFIALEKYRTVTSSPDLFFGSRCSILCSLRVYPLSWRKFNAWQSEEKVADSFAP
mmetsp:Transcript_21369/g.62312  ORF Transcript_21369/g.62312 Transcript_21369/m.62312 type:complete len:92 (+) Transcript_21369:490-765(+)